MTVEMFSSSQIAALPPVCRPMRGMPLMNDPAIAAFDAVVELDRVGRVEIDDAVVFDPDTRDAVAGGGDDPRVVEPDLQRAGFDVVVVIGGRGAEAEMPFADDAGGVAGAFQQRGDGRAVGVDEQAFDAAMRCRCPSLRKAYSPVRNEYREGVQTEAIECASVMRNPCAASRSMFGVWTFVAP